MAKRRRAPIETQSWTVTSVGVKTRDGPVRLEQVYRILLQGSDAHAPVAWTTEANDGEARSGVAP